MNVSPKAVGVVVHHDFVRVDEKTRGLKFQHVFGYSGEVHDPSAAQAAVAQSDWDIVDYVV